MLCLSESFLSEIPEKESERFLSEVVFFPKLFHPRVFDFNVYTNFPGSNLCKNDDIIMLPLGLW